MLITDNKPIDRDIEDILMPFHEFECTGIDNEYVQDIPKSKEEIEELKKDFEENGDGRDFSEFVYDWCGVHAVTKDKIDKNNTDLEYGWVEVDNDGNIVEYIYRTNPNAKWDWWKIGGRWCGFFKAKPDVSAVRGSEGLMGSYSSEDGFDIIRKGDIDLKVMFGEAEKKAADLWNKIHDIVGDLSDYISWPDTLKKFEEDLEKARKFYNDQRAVVTLKSSGDREARYRGLDEFTYGLEEYVEKARKQAISCFAYIQDGEWFEKGEMGWWACVSDEKEG